MNAIYLCLGYSEFKLSQLMDQTQSHYFINVGQVSRRAISTCTSHLVLLLCRASNAPCNFYMFSENHEISDPC